MRSKMLKYQDAKLEDLGGGVSRRILAYLPEEMAVEVRFEEGAQGAKHTHPHAQCTYVLEGEFVFTIGDTPYTVGPGDTLAFAPGEEHGCVCTQKGAVLDVFAPMREDFLKG